MDAWLVLALVVAVVVAAALDFRRRATEKVLVDIQSAAATGARGTELVEEISEMHERDSDSAALVATYREVLDGASTGLAVFDAAGGIQFVNPSANEMLVGRASSALLGASVAALVRRVRDHGESEQIESDIFDPVRTVITSTAVALSDGGSVAVYMEDLSDRKRVDAMRTDFVANASHELKTPLGALSILAETLAETEDEAARARLADRLRGEALRMAHVIDDVVRLAETESLGMEFEEVNMATLIDAAAESVAALASSRGIEMVRGEIVPAIVDVSPPQVTSAIRNLLENAITYTAVKEEGGTVTYRTAHSEGHVCVAIEDTGVGVPDRYLDRIFERFFRVDRARSRESGGTGLGLSIVRNIAQAHGGYVSLTSEVGVGSTFTLCIPEAKGDAS